MSDTEFDTAEMAVIQRDRDALDAALADTDVTVRAPNRYTLLHTAAVSGKPEMANALIDRGVPIDAQDDEGKTALHRALEQEHDDVAAILLRNGADVTVEDSYGAQPLLRAVQTGNVQLVERLMEAGSDPSHENQSGMSPLDLAEEFGIDEFLRALRSNA